MWEKVFDIDTVDTGLRILPVLIALGTFVLLFAIMRGRNAKKVFFTAYEGLQQYFQKRRGSILDYQELYDYLCRNGAAFHFGKWVNPVSYSALRLVLGGTGLLIGAFTGYLQGMVLAVALFWLPDGLLLWMNKMDNERMLPELKLVYNAISMQVKAGVYVTDALGECFGSVREERLRSALFSLSGEIALKSDVESALERFQQKFDNRYIDALCITVLQALESGHAVALLADISEQIKDMEAALMNRKKGNLDRRITFYQLGILSAILIVVLYACITNMFKAAMSF